MTDKELSVAMTEARLAVEILVMLGYKHMRQLGMWLGGRNPWYDAEIDLVLASHDIAAEVKELMRKKGWLCEEVTDLYNPSTVLFWKYLCDGPMVQGKVEGKAEHNNMDEHPRAVCEAALAALKAEKESHETC